MKKRILMLGEVDFSNNDAPKIHFSNLAKEFSNLGFDVLCLVYTPRNSKFNPVSNNFSVRFLPNPLTGNLFSRSFKYFLLLPIILGHLLKFSPDIIYIRFSPPVFAYLLALKALNFLSFNFTIILESNSWVSEERKAQGENDFKVEVIDFLQIKSASLADYNRTVTSGLKSRLKKHGIANEKIVVVGNGTDILHFKPVHKSKAKETLGLDPDSLYVGFIGNFAIWQGTETLIRTIPEVWKNYPHIRFLLVGNGPEMPKIRIKASQFNSEKVILTGYVPYEKANLYINAFDIGVAPFIRKRNENIGLSPLKIRDYAACGTPIITTRIKGLEMVEKRGIGILVAPDDSEALSDAIKKLIENPNLRNEMCRKGRKTAEKEFSWKKIARQILDKTGYSQAEQ